MACSGKMSRMRLISPFSIHTEWKNQCFSFPSAGKTGGRRSLTRHNRPQPKSLSDTNCLWDHCPLLTDGADLRQGESRPISRRQTQEGKHRIGVEADKSLRASAPPSAPRPLPADDACARCRRRRPRPPDRAGRYPMAPEWLYSSSTSHSPRYPARSRPDPE